MGVLCVPWSERIGRQIWEPQNTRNAALLGHIEIKTLVCVFCVFRGRTPATHWKPELGTTEYTEYTECRFIGPH
jgi:hypothetical protein